MGQIDHFGQPARSLSSVELAQCNQGRLQTPTPGAAGKIGADPDAPAAMADDTQPLPQTPMTIEPEVAVRAACPDPAAVELEARLVSHHGWEAVLDIVGIIRNLGFGPYRSESGQERRQSVELIEQSARGPDPTVQRVWFSDLEPGQEVSLVYRITWNTQPREIWTPVGSYYYPPLPPPGYAMHIAYAAANGEDRNWRNDDCNRHNNRAVLEPEDITAVVP